MCPHCYAEKCKIPVRRIDQLTALKILVLSPPEFLAASFKETLLKIALKKGKTDCFLRSILHHRQPYVVHTVREEVEEKLNLLLDCSEELPLNSYSLNTMLKMLKLRSFNERSEGDSK